MTYDKVTLTVEGVESVYDFQQGSGGGVCPELSDPSIPLKLVLALDPNVAIANDEFPISSFAFGVTRTEVIGSGQGSPGPVLSPVQVVSGLSTLSVCLFSHGFTSSLFDVWVETASTEFDGSRLSLKDVLISAFSISSTSDGILEQTVAFEYVAFTVSITPRK